MRKGYFCGISRSKLKFSIISPHFFLNLQIKIKMGFGFWRWDFGIGWEMRFGFWRLFFGLWNISYSLHLPFFPFLSYSPFILPLSLSLFLSFHSLPLFLFPSSSTLPLLLSFLSFSPSSFLSTSSPPSPSLLTLL